MSTHFHDYSREQPYLLPASPQDWLPSDHLAYLVRDLVSELDLSVIYRSYQNETWGAPPFDPRMLVALLLYAWTSDVYSTRQIERLCLVDLGARYLAAGYRPVIRTINNFRLRHGKALAGFFGQSVRLCQRAGMVSLDRDVAVRLVGPSNPRLCEVVEPKGLRGQIVDRDPALLPAASRTLNVLETTAGSPRRGVELEDLPDGSARARMDDGNLKTLPAGAFQPVRRLGLKASNYSDALDYLPEGTGRGLVYLQNTISLAPLWVPALLGSAFNIFILRQFFATIPVELGDSARMDGCTPLRSHWSIMLPQVKPPLIVIGIWTFMGAWSNFMGPLVYITYPESMPLSYALQLFKSERGDPTLQRAFAVMTTLPVIAVFFVVQKQIMENATLSGMGGR